MKYEIKNTIDFKAYEKKYRQFFEKLCKLVDESYRKKDLKRRKPRNPIEERILKMLQKQSA